VDISGNGLNGTLYGNTSYSSSMRSFDFDGLGADYILKSSPSGLPTGDAIYSMSAWINIDSSIGNLGVIISFGSSWASTKLASMYVKDGNKLGGDIGANQVYTTNAVLSYNTWHHVAITKKSTGAISTAMFDLYVDGTLITAKTVYGTGTQNLGTISGVSVGMGFAGSVDRFPGKISKPKLWNVVLTAEEVAMEYALGRTGKSINLTDTALCLGGTVPRAQLDVRGSALVGGIEITGDLVIPSGTSAQQPTGVTGMLRFNTTFGKLQVYDGNLWIDVGPNPTNATGGTVTYVDGYTIHTFTSSDTFTVYTSGDVEYLVVAGGGGGGGNHGGAGGAGGYISGSSSIAIGAYTITVGGGGAGGTSSDNGTNGSNSVFNSLIALGGGGGGHGYSNSQSNAGLSGGSGGGGAPFRAGGTTSDSAQGNNGGNGLSSGIAGHGGGGGGAGGAGGNALISGADDAGISGAGGIGLSSSITGTAVVRAGGGSGGRWGGTNTNPGAVGDVGTVQGGGGKGGAETNSGYVSVAGTANTGGGGGGGGDSVGPGAAGGSGIVIIRYLT
jgi:hypothetical protein